MTGWLQEIFSVREDADRCRGSLLKLTRHVETPLMLTGSLAVSCHLLRAGAMKEKGRLRDIDVVVEGISSLCPTLRRDFLVRHFHPARERGKILLMLVDEEFGTRIDVFTPAVESLTERLASAATDEIPLRLISAEDLLAKLLSIACAVTAGRTVEPKYLEAFRTLSAVADLAKARGVWREYRKDGEPLEFEQAAAAVRRCSSSNPALLRAASYSQDLAESCAWCAPSELFPLAPLGRIHRILGYV